MSRKVLVPLGLLATTNDPTGHNVGEMYFNTTSSKVKIYTGSFWVDVNTDSVNVVDGGTP
jgi:hypothetical protein